MKAQIQSGSTTTTTTLDVASAPKPPATSSSSVDKQNRIPSALQVVFLSSNRGSEVNQPPPARVADKVYVRNWCFQQGGSKNGSKRRSSFSSGENEEAPPPIIRRDSMPRLEGVKKKKSDIPEDQVCSSFELPVSEDVLSCAGL